MVSSSDPGNGSCSFLISITFIQELVGRFKKGHQVTDWLELAANDEE